MKKQAKAKTLTLKDLKKISGGRPVCNTQGGGGTAQEAIAAVNEANAKRLA